MELSDPSFASFEDLFNMRWEPLPLLVVASFFQLFYINFCLKFIFKKVFKNQFIFLTVPDFFEAKHML